MSADTGPAHTDYDTSEEVPEDERCSEFEQCGNGTPGENVICDTCLSAMRAKDAISE